MSNFFHRLFNPHCPDCIAENAERKHCNGCEVLREQLERLTEENKKLFDSILEMNKPRIEPVVTEQMEEVKPRFVPWRVKQQELEKNDRETARLLRVRQNEIDLNKINDLEKELDITGEENAITK